MNHAVKISTNGKSAGKKKRTTIAPTVGRVREMDKTSKGCRGTAKRQEQVSAACDVANAFLGVQFPPSLQEPQFLAGCNRGKLEREFYASLSTISRKFNCTKLDCNNIPFPYNISVSLEHLKKELQKNIADWKEIRLIKDGDSIYFAREERYNTGCTLYYIPVIPLYNLLHNKKTEDVANLLVSVYAYIYLILGVPYYRTDGCYLNSMYEMLENWIIEDGDGEEMLIEINDAKLIGDYMKELIGDTEQLNSFQQRLKDFKPKDDFEKKVLSVATSFYSLYLSFPDMRIDSKFYPLRFREETEDDGRAISLDDYVSFCASIDGQLFETLFQSVNDEFQEYGEVDEPTRFIPFDNRKIENNDFDFEDRVFNEIDNLVLLWQ